MLRERITAGLDLFIGSLDLRGLEWRFSNQLRVSTLSPALHDDSHRPNIHLVGMPLPFQNLRRDVIGRPADGLLLLFVVLQPRSQSKIPQLDPHVLIQKQIA